MKPNSSLKTVAVIGTGSIGERHIRCFQATGRARVAVCEINPQLRRRITEEYAIEHHYANINEIPLEGLDAAVVAVPAHLHLPLAVRLVEAGVPVLIEKPLSVSLDGVDEFMQAVARRKVTVAVAYVYRTHPATRALKAAIVEGRFGRPVQIVATGGQHFPKYRPAYREIYYNNRATGGGCIQDALTHLVNTCQWLVGPATQVFADAGHQVLPGVEVEDTAHLLTRHTATGRPGDSSDSVERLDVLGCFSLNQHQPANELTLQVNFERGAAQVQFHRRCWRWATEPDAPWTEECFQPLERDALFTAQADSFLDAVENKSPPLCSLAEGVKSLYCSLAALASLDSGKWETVGGREISSQFSEARF